MEEQERQTPDAYPPEPDETVEDDTVPEQPDDGSVEPDTLTEQDWAERPAFSEVHDHGEDEV